MVTSARDPIFSPAGRDRLRSYMKKSNEGKREIRSKVEIYWRGRELTVIKSPRKIPHEFVGALGGRRTEAVRGFLSVREKYWRSAKLNEAIPYTSRLTFDGLELELSFLLVYNSQPRR